MKRFARLLVATGLRAFAAVFSIPFLLVAKTGYGSRACLRRGWLPVPVHYYQPIVDPEDVDWTRRSRMHGIDFNEDGQFALLETLGQWAPECDWPQTGGDGYYSRNPSFGYASGALLHAMVRHHQPERVIEVGAGMSTMIFDGALRENGHGELVSIDPYPHPILERVTVQARQVRAKVQDVELSFRAGDMLFIDSSHVVKAGSDVNHLILDVLPILPAGVLVHVHDIMLPFEYQRELADREAPPPVFWNEQYLLQAYLAGNPHVEVLLAGWWLMTEHREAFEAAFPAAWGHRATSSFYMRTH